MRLAVATVVLCTELLLVFVDLLATASFRNPSVSFCFRVATDIHCSCTTSPSSPVSYWRASRHWLHCLPPLPLRPPLCPCPDPGTKSLTPQTWPLCQAQTCAATWHRGRAAQSPDTD